MYACVSVCVRVHTVFRKGLKFACLALSTNEVVHVERDVLTNCIFKIYTNFISFLLTILGTLGTRNTTGLHPPLRGPTKTMFSQTRVTVSTLHTSDQVLWLNSYSWFPISIHQLIISHVNNIYKYVKYKIFLPSRKTMAPEQVKETAFKH